MVFCFPCLGPGALHKTTKAWCLADKSIDVKAWTVTIRFEVTLLLSTSPPATCMRVSVFYWLLTDLCGKAVLSWCILGVDLTGWFQNMQLCLYVVNSTSFLYFLLACIICSHCTISFSKSFRILNRLAVTYHLCCTPQQGPQRPPEKLFRWPKSWKLRTDYWNVSTGCTPCTQVV